MTAKTSPALQRELDALKARKEQTTMIRRVVGNDTVRSIKEVKNGFAVLYLVQLDNLINATIRDQLILGDKQLKMVFDLEDKLLQIAEEADEGDKAAINVNLENIRSGFRQLTEK